MPSVFVMCGKLIVVCFKPFYKIHLLAHNGFYITQFLNLVAVNQLRSTIVMIGQIYLLVRHQRSLRNNVGTIC